VKGIGFEKFKELFYRGLRGLFKNGEKSRFFFLSLMELVNNA
jgi:hypothetical protein